MRNQEEMIELQKKLHRRISVRTSLLWLHILLLMSFFVTFFVYSDFTSVYSPVNIIKLKVNESRYIAYLWSADLSKIFSQLIVSINKCLFSLLTLHCLHHDSLTLTLIICLSNTIGSNRDFINIIQNGKF